MKLIKNFRFQVISQVVLIVLMLLLISIYLLPQKLWVNLSIVLIVLFIQVGFLIYTVEKTNRLISQFLLAVQFDDGMASFFDELQGPTFQTLACALESIMEKLRHTRMEREEQYRYLQTILHHLGMGLIVYRQDGEIDLINTAAKRLLKVGGIKNIRGLKEYTPLLADTLASLKHGDHVLVKTNEEMEFSVHASQFLRGERLFTLVSFQDITGELQGKELEAWQTLIRVLTHEIKNSMTPISSMTDTLYDWLTLGGGAGDGKVELSAEMATDIRGALKAINRRSQALAQFIDAYRHLTLIPKPDFKVTGVRELLDRVQGVLQGRLLEQRVDFSITVEPGSLEITADAALIEQVLINIIINALEALEQHENPMIKVIAGMDDMGRPFIQVMDNGPGILAEALDKIFIPFFSTKKQGSGIGLSLSRQVMKLHRGCLTVHSVPGVETVFSLWFR